MRKIQRHKCPYCLGSGFVNTRPANQKYPDEIKRKALVLYRDKGMTYRQVAKELGFNHPESVRNLIKTYIKSLTK